MKTTKSLYIASAVFSAVSVASTASVAKVGYDAAQKLCYGSALAGQNDCSGPVHSCKGQATADCHGKDWILAMSEEDCNALIAKNCPQNKS